ncbi:MAG: outer membrane beta-barrel protein [Sphingobium sp.]|nr:outer membrane beta-barrel protein [Sphingobium sp.]
MKSAISASLGATLALVLATPAMAQEGDKVDWTGPYVGLSFGYNWQSRDNQENLRFDTNGDGTYNDVVRTGAGADAFSPGFCGGASTSGVGEPRRRCNGDKDAIGWNVHAGYDRQFGNIVAGVVVEGGDKYISDSVTGFSTTPASYTMTRRIGWDAAGRVRLGVTTDSGIMAYGTGGIAYAKVKNSFSHTQASATANSFIPTDSKEDAWGWTVGGGVEAKVADNFSIGLLYKFTRYNVGDYNVRVERGGAAATNPFIITPAGYTDVNRGDKFDVHSTMVTASFRF